MGIENYTDQPCAACNANPGEPCRPHCIGKAAQIDAEPFKPGDRVKVIPTGTVADTQFYGTATVTGYSTEYSDIDVYVRFDDDEAEYGFTAGELELCDEQVADTL